MIPRAECEKHMCRFTLPSTVEGKESCDFFNSLLPCFRVHFLNHLLKQARLHCAWLRVQSTDDEYRWWDWGKIGFSEAATLNCMEAIYSSMHLPGLQSVNPTRGGLHLNKPEELSFRSHVLSLNFWNFQDLFSVSSKRVTLVFCWKPEFKRRSLILITSVSVFTELYQSKG